MTKNYSLRPSQFVKFSEVSQWFCYNSFYGNVPTAFFNSHPPISSLFYYHLHNTIFLFYSCNSSNQILKSMLHVKCNCSKFMGTEEYEIWGSSTKPSILGQQKKLIPRKQSQKKNRRNSNNRLYHEIKWGRSVHSGCFITDIELIEPENLWSKITE